MIKIIQFEDINPKNVDADTCSMPLLLKSLDCLAEDIAYRIAMLLNRPMINEDCLKDSFNHVLHSITDYLQEYGVSKETVKKIVYHPTPDTRFCEVQNDYMANVKKEFKEGISNRQALEEYIITSLIIIMKKFSYQCAIYKIRQDSLDISNNLIVSNEHLKTQLFYRKLLCEYGFSELISIRLFIREEEEG